MKRDSRRRQALDLGRPAQAPLGRARKPIEAQARVPIVKFRGKGLPASVDGLRGSTAVFTS